MDPLGVSEAVTVEALVGGERRIASGTKTDTPLRDVPQAISVVSRDLIADKAMSTMADVVELCARRRHGAGEGHRDAPIFRGNTSTADFYVDGLRDDTQYFRDLYNVERVEVLKGPNGDDLRPRRRRRRHQSRDEAGQWDLAPRSVASGRIVWTNAGSRPTSATRLTADVSARVTGMYKNSGSYRADAGLERVGINPSFEAILGPQTRLRAGYEFFHDDRTVDRGLPSLDGRPIDADPSLFIGNVDANNSDITVHAALVPSRTSRSRTG